MSEADEKRSVHGGASEVGVSNGSVRGSTSTVDPG